MSKTTLAVVLTAIVTFPLGLVAGFALGVHSSEFGKKLLAVAAANEEPADLAQPQSISRKHYQLQYPRNWKLAKDEEHFDIDQYFSIDTPGHSYVLFDIYRVESSPRDNVLDSLDYFNKLLRIEDESSFDAWGKYRGVGVRLAGDYVGEPCVVRIFSHTSDNRSFTVTEFYDTATEHFVQPGFDLVEATFELKPPDDSE